MVEPSKSAGTGAGSGRCQTGSLPPLWDRRRLLGRSAVWRPSSSSCRPAGVIPPMPHPEALRTYPYLAHFDTIPLRRPIGAIGIGDTSRRFQAWVEEEI